MSKCINAMLKEVCTYSNQLRPKFFQFHASYHDKFIALSQSVREYTWAPSPNGMAPQISAGIPLTTRPKTSLSFAWIDVEDKDARRKARSHVTREAKQRQKLDSLRTQKLKEGGKRVLLSADAKAKPPLQSEDGGLTVLDLDTESRLPSIRTALEGLVDPFNQFPLKLTSSRDLGLVDHYFTTFRPKPFLLADCDYKPVKVLMLQVAMQDPASFLMIISGSATDIALRSGKASSKQSIEYKTQAMSIVNKRMLASKEYITDGTINACSMLAGTELLFGTPATFNIHMDGVEQMLKSRGGYEKLQQSNPLLASLLAWHDFAGAAALACHRRFVFTSCDPISTTLPLKPLEYTPPFNIPRDTLPPNYTLYDDLMILLSQLENSTSLIRTKTVNREKLKQHTDFIADLNSSLMRILSPVLGKTTPFRRFLIEDSFRVVCLIYISSTCKKYISWEIHTETILQILKEQLLDDINLCSDIIESILIFLMGGGKAESQKCVHFVEGLMKVFVGLDWDAWWGVRERLLGFFLGEEVCKGGLQELWRCRMEV